jgi:predicted aspartyl protease
MQRHLVGGYDRISVVPSAPPDQSVDKRQHSTLKIRLTEGSAFLSMTINQLPFEYVLDTGAATSLVSASEAKRLGFTVA